jgi:hypothetical protein
MHTAIDSSDPGTTNTSDTGATALRDAHDAWIEEFRAFVGPALEPEADPWTQWLAVRYLSDDFEYRCRSERALVDLLRRFIPAGVADRLVGESKRFARLRGDLDEIGRRRGTAAMFEVGGSRLLEELEVWCASVESAAREVSREG